MAAKKTSAPSTTNKSAFLRNLPRTMSLADAITKGKEAGVLVDEKYTSSIKSDAKTKETMTTPGRETAATRVEKTVKKTPARNVIGKKATPSATSRTISKSDFVRARAHLSPKEIVEDAAGAGIQLNPNHVYTVRAYDLAKGKKKGSLAGPTRKTVAKPALVAPKPTPLARSNGDASARLEDLLRAVSSELGLGRAIEILEGERARVRAVIGEG